MRSFLILYIKIIHQITNNKCNNGLLLLSSCYPIELIRQSREGNTFLSHRLLRKNNQHPSTGAECESRGSLANECVQQTECEMTSEGKMDHLSPRWKTIKRAKEGRDQREKRWRNLSSLLIALPRYFSTGRFPLFSLFEARTTKERDGTVVSKRRARLLYTNFVIFYCDAKR